MREIKFRAYIKKYNQIVEVYAIDFLKGIIRHEEFDWDAKHNKEIQLVEKTLLTNCELMQYTGFDDKYGKEIYFNDIVQWLGHEVKTENGRTFQIRPKRQFVLDGGFTGEAFKKLYNLATNGIKYAGIEVISNIYVNPELMEGEQNDIKRNNN